MLDEQEVYIKTSDDPNIWIDDELPTGAVTIDPDRWLWNNEITYSGLKSHTDPMTNDTHGHYFIRAETPMALSATDNIIQYVYLDPIYQPQEILLQFYTDNGDGEHRVYWGRNLIYTGGEHGTASLYHMGDLPVTGKWVRLKSPSSLAGLSGKKIKGLAFVSYKGKVYWDKTTKSSDFNETQEEYCLPTSQVSSNYKTNTTINYSISQDANISLSIYDQDNHLIKNVLDAYIKKGSHQIVWDGTDYLGHSVDEKKYYFQFSKFDGPIDSNTYAMIPGISVSEPVEIKSNKADSSGNYYQIDFENNIVNKYDSQNLLLFSITKQNVGTGSFTPIDIDLDLNDNIFILDNRLNKIFKLNPNGYYLNEFPEKIDVTWSDKSFVLNKPVGMSINNNGDILISNHNGNETIKLSVGRGVVDSTNIIAKIRVPYENALVSHTIPIIGTASANNFSQYNVEFGAGYDPTKWTTLVTSTSKAIDDHKPLPPSITVHGNLAYWDTVKLVGNAGPNNEYYYPMGPYTIRLTVFNKEGAFKQDTVHVEIARLMGQWGGTLFSNDLKVKLDIPKAAINDDFDLFSIKHVEKEALLNNSELALVGKIYEIRPAGYTFLKDCRLTMYYSDSDLAGIDVNTLNIYSWDSQIHKWTYEHSSFDIDNNSIYTTLKRFTNNDVYYAILSDPLHAAPTIYSPISPTYITNITVNGKANPGVKVQLFVNDVFQKDIQTNINSGFFELPGIYLDYGENYLTAQSINSAGRKSPKSKPIKIRFIHVQPTSVFSVKFMNETFSNEQTESVTIGDQLCIEMIGTDNDPELFGTAIVNINSNLTDPSGISIQLIETENNSGTFRGKVKISENSDQSSGSIGISTYAIETITVISKANSDKKDQITTADMIPPPAPIITSPTHPSLCQNTFETDIDQWKNMSDIYGANINRTTDYKKSGKYSLKLVNIEKGGNFASYIRTESFDARDFPVVCFDYKIPEDLKLNIIAHVNGMWKEIVFTDDAKTVRTFTSDLYRTIGHLKNITPDNNWHQAEFNLYNMLKMDEPNQDKYIVEELFFADYNLEGWMELIMGEENSKGMTFYIDNFIISTGGQSNNNPEFNWDPNDLSVEKYAYKLDRISDTVPEINNAEISTINLAKYNNVEDGIWFFHVRSIDKSDNWGSTNHYKIVIDTTGPKADLPFPENGSKSASLDIQLRITDENGSGVDPDSIRLMLDNDIYCMGSTDDSICNHTGGLIYDNKTKLLTLSLWNTYPLPKAWSDGEIIRANLIEAKDFAGNSLQKQFEWSWDVEYSDFKGGSLSILTTQGGNTPTWSPDGNKIAFMSERSGNQEIWVINAQNYAESNAFGVTRLTQQMSSSELRTVNNHHPAWSSKIGDNTIAFVSNIDGYDHIYLINEDGSGLRQLTKGNYDDSHPTWSPDGARIAFSRIGEIWSIGADGTDEKTVTSNSIENCLEPAWSHHDMKIAYTKSLYIDEIAVMNTDGTDQKDLIRNISGFNSLPTWSNNNQEIFFVHKKNEASGEIYVINSNGSNKKNYLSDSKWWDTEPEQSPTDQRLAFQSTRNGTWNIWIKKQAQIIQIHTFPNALSPNGDGNNDTIFFSIDIEGGSAVVNLSISDYNENIVATLLKKELIHLKNNNILWDGTDEFKNIVNDGIYNYHIEIIDSENLQTQTKSGQILVDTESPIFSNWIIPRLTQGPHVISVKILDRSMINLNASKLQYGISTSENNHNPDIISWTTFGKGGSGTLDLSWLQYKGKFLYIRAYAIDILGNANYSDIQKRFIEDVNTIKTVKIPLQSGWNKFIFNVDKCYYIETEPGVPMIENIEYIKVDSIDTILSSINGYYSYVKGYDASGQKTFNLTKYSDMKYMAAGYEYWINVNEDANFDDNGFIYLEVEGNSIPYSQTVVLSGQVETNHYKNFNITEAGCVYTGRVTINEQSDVSSQDEIGVFVNNESDNEILVGACKIGTNISNHYYVNVYGDLLETQHKEGASNNDQLIFKFWSYKSDREITISQPEMEYSYYQGIVKSDIPPIWKNRTSFGLLNFNIKPSLKVNFSNSKQWISEDSSIIEILIVLNERTNKPVLAPLSITGTAIENGVDYIISSKNIYIPAGNIATTITCTVLDDDLFEFNETIVINMGIPENAIKGENTIHTIYIKDNDPKPTVRWNDTHRYILENAGSEYIKATLNVICGVDVQVPYIIGGTARGYGEDHTLQSGTITIPAGHLTGVTNFNIINDNIIEDKKTIIVKMQTPINATIYSFDTYTMTIIDDDNLQILDLDVPSIVHEEDGVLNNIGKISIPFTISSDLTVALTSGDLSEIIILSDKITIPAGEQSQTFDLKVIDDNDKDGDVKVEIKATAKGWEPANATIVVKDNDKNTLLVGKNGTYSSIQAAVDDAKRGDLILVSDGTYNENVIVDKSITIFSSNGYTSTFVIAKNRKENVFKIQEDDVTIKGFTIYGANRYNKAGIFIDNSVSECSINSNRCGYDQSHNNNVGIIISSCNDSNVFNNICNANTQYGILITSSFHNNIFKNICNKNNFSGITTYESRYNVISQNICNYNKSVGFSLFSTYDNSIHRNIVSLNDVAGFYLFQSSSNKLYLNIINSNKAYGIFVFNQSHDNQIYCNNLINNLKSNTYSNCKNQWSTIEKINYIYLGQPFESILGNYYSDQLFQDSDNNGISEEKYKIYGMNDTDMFPLIETTDKYVFSQSFTENPRTINEFSVLAIKSSNTMSEKRHMSIKNLDTIEKEIQVALTYLSYNDNNLDKSRPTIEFTHIPPYGNMIQTLEGKAFNVKPNTHNLVVYIHNNGWRIKPYLSKPLTPININGRWKCDITTAANDKKAKMIAAFLLPEDYYPPLLRDALDLPTQLYEKSVSSILANRESNFGFTYIPPLGNRLKNVEGYVQQIQTDNIVAILYIFTDAWRLKPSKDNPFTLINSDGNWICDITTESYDQNATKISAFLFSKPLNIEIFESIESFPKEYYHNSIQSIKATRMMNNDIQANYKREN